MTKSSSAEKQLLRLTLMLAVITVCYNIIEGGFSTILGWHDEMLALFGFGVDSFVEVVSGLGILHMVLRMRHESVSGWDRFERQALYVTGAGFFLLTIGLVAGALLNIYYGAKPDTTIPGMVISLISIATMWFLYKMKMKVGLALGSEPILSDAACTKTCLYLSFILFAASVIYLTFQVPYVDAVGSLGIAFLSFREGREAFEKARHNRVSCSCSGNGHNRANDTES